MDSRRGHRSRLKGAFFLLLIYVLVPARPDPGLPEATSGRPPAPARIDPVGAIVRLALRDEATQADLDRLHSRGVTLLRPLGRGQGIYRVREAAALHDPAVKEARVVLDDKKISAILPMIFAANGGASTGLHVQFDPGVPYAEAAALLAGAGAGVMRDAFEVGAWLPAAGDEAAVAALAADPRVMLVFPAPTPPEKLNVTAASVAKVNQLHPGGASGYSVDGTGVVLALWDGGPVRATHQELSGRVTILDGAGTDDHATHVCGTMIASGVNAGAKGMSIAATVRSWDFFGSPITEWDTDKANYDAANNSWGFITGWRFDGATWQWYGPAASTEDPNFGKYTSSASQADNVTENDDVIQLKSAGNDRGEPGTAGSHGHAGAGSFADFHEADNFDNGGYDSLSNFSAAKNPIIVGAITDAKAMSSFSSWGPCDDGRIKPDVVANGTGLTSSVDSSDSAYASFSGTSMSGPTATGAVGLLIHHMRNSGYGAAYRPPLSLVKALLIQTAEDLGTAGPDYQFGYGNLDARAAADLIAADAGAFSRLKHETLANGGSFSFTITLGAPADIRVTLAWSDLNGAANVGGLDDATPALVHDLNLRIEGPPGATTYRPYKLNVAAPADPATTGINTVDNVEQVTIASAPAGTYTVTIDHAGSLLSPQKFSLAASHALPAGGGSPTAPTALSVSSPASPKPKFSAQHNDPESDAADRRRIEVNTAADFSGTVMWDEGAAGVPFAPSIAAGAQSQEFLYAGSPLSWNTTYAWRIRFWDVNGNESDPTTGTLSMGTPTAALPNPSGWQMVAVPSGASVSTGNISGIGGAYYWWNEATQSYEAATTLEPGRGYFVSTSGTAQLNAGQAIFDPFAIGGLTATPGAPYSGWHMVGNVYNGTISWDTIYDGGFTTNLEATYAKWDGTQYVTYNALTNSGAAGATIGPFQAFWVRVVPEGAVGSLTLQPPSFAEAGVPTPFDANWWLLQVAATSGTLVDDQNWVGVHALADDGWDARDASDPGTIANPYVKVYVEHADWAPYPDKYQQDVRKTPYNAGDTVAWTITVEVSNAPMDVTVSFPNLAEMPAEWSFDAADFTYTQATPTAQFTIAATRLAAGVGTLEVKLGGATPAGGEFVSGQTLGMMQIELIAAGEDIVVDPLPVFAEGTASVGAIFLDPPGPIYVAEGTSQFVWVEFQNVTGDAGAFVRAILEPGLVTATGQTTGTSIAGNGVFIEGPTMAIPAAEEEPAPVEADVPVAVGGGGGVSGCGMQAPFAGSWWISTLALLLAARARPTRARPRAGSRPR